MLSLSTIIQWLCSTVTAIFKSTFLKLGGAEISIYIEIRTVYYGQHKLVWGSVVLYCLFFEFLIIAIIKSEYRCRELHIQRCTGGHGQNWFVSMPFNIFPCRKTVVCPIIDVISDDTFEYMAGSDMTYGGFNWKLNFRWYPVPQREMDRRKGDRTLPVR